ncbi:MAG: methyl-accepting chemotaxis protein [Oscillospiraceae bacterium]|jgi:methyl-accepting chemotaxis protein|nr:methyl-accepting chemotaxis protein [Oscillospiraceae bacterium]MCI1990121.1 methyl-accepting chemotaxis protein [Oscillospiraceae bacterium]MCI2034500.1 methyl-accepting chemotaxis protein [Oscillospiraceae bacterium]
MLGDRKKTGKVPLRFHFPIHRPAFRKKAETTGGAKKKSIRRRLLGSMVCLTVAVCVVISVLMCVLFYRSEKDNMEKQVTKVALAYDEAVKNAIGNYQLNAEAIAANPGITDPKEAKSEWKATLNVLLTSAGFDDGGIANMEGKTLDGKDISKEDYFTKASYGSTVMSDPTKLDDGTMVVYVASKISNGTGYEGVFYATLPCNTFNQVISGVSVGDKGYGFLVNATGKIVAHKDIDKVLKQVNYLELAKKDSSYQGIGALVQRMTAFQAGSNYFNMDGSRKFMFYAPIVGTTWSLGVVADVDEMMSTFNRSIYYIIGVAVLLIIVSVVCSFLVAKPVVRPIEKMMKRIGTLASGDLHSEVPAVHTHDEIERLSDTLRSTIESLNGYIAEISNVLGSMAQGDFTVRARLEYRGDFAAIKEALDSIVASMSETFSGIHGTAEQVAGGSRQMAGASQALAQGASEQSGTIQELSSSVRKIAEQADQSAKNASQANELSDRAVKDVSGGTERMNRMSSAMARIRESSGKIEKIIKTIQDIAFQTNILALNAAVEAARAGEAGRGFSVVADEVRNLANRSAEAVKSTSALIQASAEAVQDGQKTAEETAEYLKNVVETVKKMSELLQSISSAAGEQAKSVGRVNTNVEQITAVVQTNSATAEESAATSEELSKLAVSMNDTLARFHLSEQAAQS